MKLCVVSAVMLLLLAVDSLGASIPKAQQSFGRLGKARLSAPARVNASGSRLQGYATTYKYGDVPAGWYEFDLDGTVTLKWEYHDPEWEDDGWGMEPAFPFRTAFMTSPSLLLWTS